MVSCHLNRGVICSVGEVPWLWRDNRLLLVQVQGVLTPWPLRVCARHPVGGMCVCVVVYKCV